MTNSMDLTSLKKDGYDIACIEAVKEFQCASCLSLIEQGTIHVRGRYRDKFIRIHVFRQCLKSFYKANVE